MAKKFMDLVTEVKGYTQDFILWPKQWRSYPGHDLKWVVLKFTKSGLRQLPDEQGVYAFLVRPRLEKSLEVSYLIYVGQTERSLHERCNTYFSYMKDELDRPRMLDLLSKYKNFTYLAYACVDKPKQVENDLLDAFIPPGNTIFTSSISKVIRAFR